MENFYQMDIDSLRESLITFFKNQDEFKDTTFAGSGTTEIMNLLAFAVKTQNLYLNFSGSELFLNTAEKAESVYKIANTLNYIPKRKSAAYMTVNLQRSSAVTVIIPKYTVWSLGSISLTNLTDIIINNDSVHSVTLYQGTITTETFTSDGSDFQTYQLAQRESIDNTNLFVFVDPSDGSGGYTVSTTAWKNVNKENLTIGSNGYYIHYFEKMQIKFDNGNLYAKPATDARVRVVYLLTTGATPNGSSGTVTCTGSGTTNADKMSITATSTLANGVNEESTAAIKLRAPQFYTTQNRAITENDYNVLLKTYSYYSTFHSGIVWGGEKEYINQNSQLIESSALKDLGHIYVSAIKSDYSYLTTTEQTTLLNYLNNFKIITLFLKFMHPSIVTIKPTVNISYSSAIDLNLINLETTINNHLKANNGYSKNFYLSDLISYVTNLTNVVYTTITYTTSVIVNQPNVHHVVRLGNAVNPSSITATIGAHVMTDNGTGNLMWNGVTVGTITYATGHITIDYNFGVSNYTINFTFTDQSHLNFEKDTFLKYNDITLNTL